MRNQRVWDAGFDDRKIEEILTGFRETRGTLVERLENMKESAVMRSAMHPRLGVPMRVCDMMFFEAEHDDYHLARISELLRLWCHRRP